MRAEWFRPPDPPTLLGGQAPQIFLTLPQAIPTSIPIPLKKQIEIGAKKMVRKLESVGKIGSLLLGTAVTRTTKFGYANLVEFDHSCS